MQDLHQKLLQAMRSAGQELLERPDFAVHNKNGNYDFVTDMDVRMQERMRVSLGQIMPEAAFVSEEDTTEKPEKGQYYWLLDPIDGTTNFVRDLHLSCIAVALCQDETVLVGAVYLPWADEFFFAQAGQGASCNGKPIHVSDREMHNAVANIGQGYGKRADSYVRMQPIHQRVCTECVAIRAFGSSEISLCYVAAGRVDVYTEQAIMPWDYAAGGLIVREAGGMISNWQGNPCALTHGDSMIAGNPRCYASLLSTTKTVE